MRDIDKTGYLRNKTYNMNMGQDSPDKNGGNKW